MMPPPNVTGSLHMGHALNNTLQDVLTRFHRKQGSSTLWQPGMDHAGIATQMVVERQLSEEGITRHELGRDDFINKVWEWKEESGGLISQQLRRLGASADWSRERFTMDEGLSEAVTKVFVDLYEQGLIYKDKRLVNWDPKLLTAISDLEVEQREIYDAQIWHIKYPIENLDGQYVVVATTRPETMLGDTAIAVNPEDERWNKLIGKNVILPLVNRLIPIIGDNYADPEQGSGALKITPAHDFNDFDIGRRHGLDMINIFDAHAHLNNSVPEAYVGLERFEARKIILAQLEDLDLIYKVEPHPHAVPFGDRSGVIIEPWLTDQWYLNAEVLAGPAINAVESGKIQFIPKQWENTYFEWMRNIQPWCISRQLWWGHQIPAWYGPDGNVFVAKDVDHAQALAFTHYGKEVDLSRDQDVLDTWFSSGLWPFSTLGWPDSTKELKAYYPNTDLITGFDIIFFWVARMIMLGIHFMDDVPFRKVYIHALVRDEKGQKMSKSKGNVIDPINIINKYGADALRFTLVAMEAQGRDIKLSESRVEGYRNFATKLWNAARFCESNNCNSSTSFQPQNCKAALSRWIISEVTIAARDIEKSLYAYRFNDAAQAIYKFTWATFCDWHLELSKIYLSSTDSKERDEIRAVTGWALDQILHLLHPIMPFVTEELWGTLSKTREKLLIETNWPCLEDNLIDKEASSEIKWVIRLVRDIRTVRGEMNVPASAKITVRVRELSSKNLSYMERNKDSILRLARLSSLDILNGPVPAGSAQIVIDEATIVLLLADIVDIDLEKTRLEKEIVNFETKINKANIKLKNKEFLSKAPKEIIEEQNKRLTEATIGKDKVLQAIKRLTTN
tara:strand:- start:38118 stop:40658 length:2541 start_codon:yes stop_codon:yes gene_type:complete